MVPKCPLWFLAWYLFNPESKLNPIQNENQYLTHIEINSATNIKTLTKPDSISKPRFEYIEFNIDSRNQPVSPIPCLQPFGNEIFGVH